MKPKKKKILIIGPFNENGGREVEASFIYNTLKSKYEVTIASTEVLSNDSLIFKLTQCKSFFSKIKRTGIKFKIFHFFFSDKLWFRLNRGFKFTTYEDLISNTDLVFILAQLLSPNIQKVISLSVSKQKKIVFRTTGTNPIFNVKFLNSPKIEILKKVDVYIHHSKNNFLRMKNNFDHNFEIIDQAVFLEEILEHTKCIEKIREFYFAARIDKNKNLELVINVFNELKDFDVELHVYGSGEELNFIKSISKSEKIFFYGYVENQELMKRISNHDCLIISSHAESGPYTALEAMANSRLILSTNVGAMSERLENSTYDWQFSADSQQSLKLKILELAGYDKNKINIIQNYLNDRYRSCYSSNEIKNKYLKVVDRFFS